MTEGLQQSVHHAAIGLATVGVKAVTQFGFALWPRHRRSEDAWGSKICTGHDGYAKTECKTKRGETSSAGADRLMGYRRISMLRRKGCCMVQCIMEVSRS